MKQQTSLDRAALGQEPDIAPEDFTLEAKLSHAKRLFDKQEQDIFKMRTELKRSETLIKKLQETATLQGQNQNNTSSTFTLPSEFKKSWEELVQETLLDVFSSFFDQHCLLVWLVRDVTELVYDYVMQEVDRKLTALLGLFALDNAQKEGVKKAFLRMFQDNCTKMIPLTDDVFSELRLRYERKTRAYIPQKQRTALVQMLESTDFREFVAKWLKLCLHMILSEPRITVTFNKQLNYSVLSQPEDYYCIDGFPKGNPKCVVVLPAPIRGASAYQGIKPAVLILSKDQPELTPDEQQAMLLKTDEDGDSMEMTSPLISEPPVPHIPPLTMDGLQDNEDAHSDQPETPVSFLKAKQATYAQRYEQKVSMSKSPYARKASPQHKDEQMALVNRFKNLKQYESKAKASSKLTEEDDDSRYSTMPLQVRKTPLMHKTVKQIAIQQVFDSGLKARKSFDEMPSSTQRLKSNENLCPHCRSKMPCHRCEGLRTLALDAGYSKPSRAHSSSVLDPDQKSDVSTTTTLMKKRMESAKRAIRQNEPNRSTGKEACKVM